MRGKVVLITGASSGIGAETAVHFAAKGCHLSLTGRSETGLQDTLKACIRAGAKEVNILLISADLQVTENLPSIVEKTVNKFGKLDVLVNNAGMMLLNSFEKSSIEQYDQVMNTNMKSVFFLTQSALPHLLKSKGNIVNVSSVAAHRFITDHIIYNMTKAAMDHFTKTLALDVAAKKVRVNAVNPGAIKTKVFDRAGMEADFEEYARQAHAMKRAGTADEIGKAILFLADDEQSSFITGVTLLVDGGLTLLGPQVEYK